MRYTGSLVGLLAGLVVLWLLLSGHYTPLLLGLGALSCLFTAWLCHRLGLIDGECVPIALLPRLPGYTAWLLGQIFKSNVDVAWRILRPGRHISPTMVSLTAGQQTALGQAIFANSVTLTPGTLTVGLTRGSAQVHALCENGTDDLEGGDIDRRVRRLEAGLPGQSPAAN